MSDIDNLRKSIDSFAKIVDRGFIAMNENLTDISLSLRRLVQEDQNKYDGYLNDKAVGRKHTYE